MTRIDGPSHGPLAGGKPGHLVVLLHGYGADGNDLIGLAPVLAPLMPDVVFHAPDAPFPCEGPSILLISSLPWLRMRARARDRA